jgi:hypothetical protein
MIDLCCLNGSYTTQAQTRHPFLNASLYSYLNDYPTQSYSDHRSLVRHSLSSGTRQSLQCIRSRSLPVPSTRSSGIPTPPALTRAQRIVVLGNWPFSSFVHSYSQRSPVPSARSCSAILQPRPSLILGPRSFLALARPAFTRLRRSPVPSVHTFSAIVCSRCSLILGARSFSALALSPRTCVCGIR